MLGFVVTIVYSILRQWYRMGHFIFLQSVFISSVLILSPLVGLKSLAVLYIFYAFPQLVLKVLPNEQVGVEVIRRLPFGRPFVRISAETPLILSFFSGFTSGSLGKFGDSATAACFHILSRYREPPYRLMQFSLEADSVEK
jgi:hypothetical protein